METRSTAVQKFDSYSLRDFLMNKEDDHHRRIDQRIDAANGGIVGRGNISGVTLETLLSDRHRPARPAEFSNRTLLDIIRGDRTAQRSNRKSWLQLNGKLRLRRRAESSSWASTASIRASAMPINSSSSNPTILPNPSWLSCTAETDGTNGRRFEPMNSLAPSIPGRETNGIYSLAGEGNQNDQQPVRMSLMALLEEADRKLGFDGPRYTTGDEEEEAGAESEQNNCCVCMVRQKGAAFIPCGHTFCRVCCRELLARRGNCPLCNNHILKILDIF